jgi:hypothetical protein
MVGNAVTPKADPARAPAPAVLSDVLVSSLEALAATGNVDAACRLAGQACAALRKNDPQGWRKFNALLHRLSLSSSRRSESQAAARNGNDAA